MINGGFNNLREMRRGLFSGIIITCLFVFFGCNVKTQQDGSYNSSHKDSIKLTSATFKTANGWGYIVMANDSIFIKQPIIPAVQGIKSFATETDAAKVGNLIITKIKAHQKPIISIADLKSLNIVE